MYMDQWQLQLISQLIEQQYRVQVEANNGSLHAPDDANIMTHVQPPLLWSGRSVHGHEYHNYCSASQICANCTQSYSSKQHAIPPLLPRVKPKSLASVKCILVALFRLVLINLAGPTAGSSCPKGVNCVD